MAFMIKMALYATGDARLDAIAPYVTSKLNRFELSDGLRLMCGQETMGLDFRAAMNQGRIMLVKLGRGRFGEATAGLCSQSVRQPLSDGGHGTGPYAAR